MKNPILIFLAVLLFASSAFPQSAEESPELKEAYELAASVVQLYDQKKYDEAFPLAKRAAQVREKLLPKTDPRVSASLRYLGDLYLIKGDYRAAEETFERLLRIFEEQFGPTSVNLAATLDRLAMLYNLKGDASVKAEEMYKRALAVREKEYGPDDIKIAKAIFSLAQFYRQQEEFDKALPLYNRTLSIYGRVSGVNSPDFQHASNGLSCLAYASSNKALFEDLNDIRHHFAPALPRIEPPDILNGRAVDLPAPGYPLIPKVRRLGGRVIVHVVIDEKGKVISATDMCQGPPSLTDAAVSAAWKARFAPTKVSGTPVTVRGVLQYRFVPY